MIDPPEGDVLLFQQNNFMSEIFILNTNRFEGLEGFDFSGGEMIVVRLKDILFFLGRKDLLYCWCLILNNFLALAPFSEILLVLLALVPSSSTKHLLLRCWRREKT